MRELFTSYTFWIAIIGCVTGCCSLMINFYQAWGSRMKLKIEPDIDSCVFFNKKNLSCRNFGCIHHGIIRLRIVNKSQNPITIHACKIECQNTPVYFEKIDCNELFFEGKCRDECKISVISIDFAPQITFPLRLEAFDSLYGYIYLSYLSNESITGNQYNLRCDFHTSRKSIISNISLSPIVNDEQDTDQNKCGE